MANEFDIEDREDFRLTKEFRAQCADVLFRLPKSKALSIREIKERVKPLHISDYRLFAVFDALCASGDLFKDESIVNITRYTRKRPEASSVRVYTAKERAEFEHKRIFELGREQNKRERVFPFRESITGRL